MEENKKKYNIMKVVIVVLIILLIIAISGGVYLYVSLRKSEEQHVSENIEINIEDTESPIITGITDKEINVGDPINILEGIEVKDNVDEKVEIVTEGEVDNTKPGEYNIKIIAKDERGNISEKTFTVIVKEVRIEKTENKSNNTEKVNKGNSETNNNSKDDNTSVSDTSSNSGTSNVQSDSGISNSNNSQPTQTGIDTVKELTNTEEKYGVEIKTYTITVYNVYSDGSKTVNSISTSTEYDRSSYSATTSELLAEARTAKSKYSSMIGQILSNTNTYRQEANAQAVNGITDRGNLTLDNDLCVAACVRAVEMAYSKKYSHTRPNGSNCFSVVDEMGISYWMAGENIANGQTSANSVSRSWKNSQGHYENMIKPDFSKIGIGVFKLDGGYYWVQLFT